MLERKPVNHTLVVDYIQETMESMMVIGYRLGSCKLAAKYMIEIRI